MLSRKERCGTMTKRNVFRLTLSTDDVQEFLARCEESEWYAFDTGERLMTDEGPDAEAVLLVEPHLLAARETRTPLVH